MTTMSPWLALGFLVILVPVFLILWVLSFDEPVSRSRPTRAHFQVLVLGDIGRSPRMQNHALSLVDAGATVDLIGYVESDVHPSLDLHALVKVHPIDPTPKILQTKSRRLFIILGPLKALYQLWSLWRILIFDTNAAKWLLVQNPPSIPTLAVAATACWLRRQRLAIDWHNYGYSILALKLGPRHPLVVVSKTYERWVARTADLNFTVSEAMSRQLKREFGIKAPIKRLYDRPNIDFRPLPVEERKEFLGSEELLSHLKGGIPKGDFKVIVSSTSWTPDEDFSILLDALVSYSQQASSNSRLPELLVIITGKGPDKESYLARIAQLDSEGKLNKVTIKTAWLSTRGYARLLASADMGISLHQSSSGVDLPMKVVDMFGAGLPVAGWGLYESWPELVKDGVNGRSFGSAGELQSILAQLLSDGDQQLAKLRQSVLLEREHDWDKEWRASAGQAFGITRTP